MKKILLVLILITSVNLATTFGPTLIKKCSICTGSIQENTLNSGNTFGAKYWTDGKREAPMLPDQPWLVKCPHCKSLIWIDEQKEIGSRKFAIENSKYPESKPFIVPEIKDYFLVLEQTDLVHKKELYLRMHAWWIGNDVRRDKSKRKTPILEEEKDNLKALYKMLSISKHRIMMAEIKRELGDFRNAELILKQTSNKKRLKVESLILELIKLENPFVAEIKFDK